MTFAVGDRVWYADNYDPPDTSLGTVIGFDQDGDPIVEWDDGETDSYFPSQLEREAPDD